MKDYMGLQIGLLIIDTPDSMDNNEAYGEIVNTMKKK